MSPTTTPAGLSTAAPAGAAPASRATRRTVDAPVRAFHALFALSFAGAWITAESEAWQGLHVTLGYAFGGLLLFRLAYGLLGPRPARLASLWRRVSGLGDWLRSAQAGRVDLPRAATLALSASMLLLLAVAGPLVLAGYAGHIDWLGLEDGFGELHEAFANVAMSLVLAHLALVVLLSVLRGRNIAAPMLTGRSAGPGPDLIQANRAWLAALVLAFWLGFVGWQASQAGGLGAGEHSGERHGQNHGERHGERHHDDD